MYLVLKLSKLCNLRCTYCSEYAELAQRARMPLQGIEFLLRGIAGRAREHGIPPRGYDFVLHGGEPLLLPDDYLSAIRSLQQRWLDPLAIPYRNVMQTNLYRIPRGKLELLKALDIRLGVSVDVFGGRRVTASGRDAQPRVLDNLQRLADAGYLERPGLGAISVLHRGNADQAEATYEFWRRLGISYRILPLEYDAAERFSSLALSNDEKLRVLKRVADRHAASDGARDVRVLPLHEYFECALRYLAGVKVMPYRVPENEWALIVNTNGDAYNSGDEYTPAGYVGNLFRQSLSAIFASPEYAENARMREARLQSCARCPYRTACPQIPVAEMPACERTRDDDGHLRCAIARPMIAHYVHKLRADPAARKRIHSWLENRRRTQTDVPQAPLR